jgi:hypothetical protein
MFSCRRHCGRCSRVLPGPRALPGEGTLFVPPFGVFHRAVIPSSRKPPEFYPRADAQ